MDIQLVLTEKCPECYGYEQYEQCSRCYGLGEVCTDDGEELLDFIHRFTVERERAKSKMESST